MPDEGLPYEDALNRAQLNHEILAARKQALIATWREACIRAYAEQIETPVLTRERTEHLAHDHLRDLYSDDPAFMEFLATIEGRD